LEALFILSRDDPEMTDEQYDLMTDEDWLALDADQVRRFEAYKAYAASIRDRLPRRTFPAYGPWYVNGDEPRGPHDATIDHVEIREPRRGREKHLRSIEINVRLLHYTGEAFMHLSFRRVRHYALSVTPHRHDPNGVTRSGQGDWLVYELRLSEAGRPICEVELANGGHWVIECDDIVYRLEALQRGPTRRPKRR
jgi:hypothetical protein